MDTIFHWSREEIVVSWTNKMWRKDDDGGWSCQLRWPTRHMCKCSTWTDAGQSRRVSLRAHISMNETQVHRVGCVSGRLWRGAEEEQ